MSRQGGSAQVLEFRSADALARLAAESRLRELLDEVDEIEGWIREEQGRHDAWAVGHPAPRRALALVKR